MASACTSPCTGRNSSSSVKVTSKSEQLWDMDHVTQLECNLDDITGEQLSCVMDLLMKHGALDVWATPIVMKKGRPAHTLHCLCPQYSKEVQGNGNKEVMTTSSTNIKDKLIEIIFRHSTTLGIRINPSIPRAKLQRTTCTVSLRSGHQQYQVRVKNSKLCSGELISSKAEFEDCKLIMEATGIPVKEIAQEAVEKVKSGACKPDTSNHALPPSIPVNKRKYDDCESSASATQRDEKNQDGTSTATANKQIIKRKASLGTANNVPDLMSRLQSFLPQLKEANEDLKRAVNDNVNEHNVRLDYDLQRNSSTSSASSDDESPEDKYDNVGKDSDTLNMIKVVKEPGGNILNDEARKAKADTLVNDFDKSTPMIQLEFAMGDLSNEPLMAILEPTIDDDEKSNLDDKNEDDPENCATSNNPTTAVVKLLSKPPVKNYSVHPMQRQASDKILIKEL